jgi:hypothetical protein
MCWWHTSGCTTRSLGNSRRTAYEPHIAPINALVNELIDPDGLGWSPQRLPVASGVVSHCGAFVVEFDGGRMTVTVGQGVHAKPGEWVRYSTPGGGAESMAMMSRTVHGLAARSAPSVHLSTATSRSVGVRLWVSSQPAGVHLQPGELATACFLAKWVDADRRKRVQRRRSARPFRRTDHLLPGQPG